MELKQLEFFIAASECGSLSKAAAKLYTSQPNVSKVIRSLEEELSGQLFERTSRGLRLTPYGKSIYEYASNIIKNAGLIKDLRHIHRQNTFYISTYQSNIMSNLIVRLYKKYSDMLIEHRQGTVEEITYHVEKGISEIGILYVSQKQLNAFINVITPKNLQFTELGRLKACVYVGKKNPLFERNTITFEEIKTLKYVSGLNGFFSIDEGLEHIELGVINSEEIQKIVYTNSEHLSTNFILQTNLAVIGIDLKYETRQYDVKKLSIEGEDMDFLIGYIADSSHMLSEYSKELIKSVEEVLKL